MAAGTEKDLALSEARRERHAAGLLGTDKIHERFMEKLLDEKFYYPILHRPARPQHRHQVWSLTQFYSADFSKSRIGVKKCVFNKRTIKVCVSCS